MKEWKNERMKEWKNERMNEWKNERMNEWTNERMNEWMNERMKEWMKEWMNGWMVEWKNERMNEWMNECMNEWINEPWLCQTLWDFLCEKTGSCGVLYRSTARLRNRHLLSNYCLHTLDDELDIMVTIRCVSTARFSRVVAWARPIKPCQCCDYSGGGENWWSLY